MFSVSSNSPPSVKSIELTKLFLSMFTSFAPTPSTRPSSPCPTNGYAPAASSRPLATACSCPCWCTGNWCGGTASSFSDVPIAGEDVSPTAEGLAGPAESVVVSELFDEGSG